MSAGKRVLDVCGALAGLLILWPLLIVIGGAISLEDGGPVFFRQERVGLGGRRFLMWKFRTMIVDAERYGRQLTIGSDARITGVGQWLRRLKLDELPQLFNVLRGEMSLVGPRPEVPRYVMLYNAEQQAVLRIMPGITDPASIRYCDEAAELARSTDPDRTYVEEIMPEKIRLNLEYAQHATVWSDVQIIFSTLTRLAGRDASLKRPGTLIGSTIQS